MFDSVLYPKWSKLWIQKDPELKLLAIEAANILGKRNSGVVTYPSINLAGYATRLLEFHRLVNESTADPHTTSRAESRRMIKMARDLVKLVRAGQWTRWLDLEHSLALCIREDDTLTSALILRTLTEEAMRAQILHSDCLYLTREVSEKKGLDELGKLYRRFLAFGLPRIEPRSNDQLRRGIPTDILGDPDAQLLLTLRSLNDYVHPNYGSHNAVLFPQSSVNGRTLLEAIISIYTSFFSETWFSKPDRVERVASPSVGKPDRDFKGEVLPGLIQWAQDVEPRYIPNLQMLGQYSSRPQLDLSLADDFPLELTSLSQLGQDLGIDKSACENPLADVEGWPNPLKRPIDRLGWVSANHAAQKLEELVSSESNSNQLMAQSMNLFASISEFKSSYFTDRTLSLIGSNLGIAATATARSVLEHHAVAVWLASRAEKKMDEFVKKRSVAELKQIEKAYAKCLVGTKSTAESASAAKNLWDGLFGQQSVNLLECIKLVGDDAISQYNYLSSVIHGFAVTGGDLLGGTASSLVREQMKVMSAITLNFCNNLESAMDRVPVLAHHKLNWLSQESNTEVSLQDAAKTLQLPGKLKLGRDFFGRGTETDPYKFRDGLSYYQAFYLFLEQEGIVYDGLVHVWHSEVGFGDMVIADEGRELYFLQPEFPGPE